MLQWLVQFAFVIVLLIRTTVCPSASDCNSAYTTSWSDCARFDVDDTSKCCLFTYGIEQVNSCHIVDMTTIASMESSVKEYKGTLSDQENFTFDCGTKVEQCLQVKAPFHQNSCLKITVPNNKTCCMLNVNNTQSCYPLTADTIENIDLFAEEYKKTFQLESLPKVLCQSKRLQFALISLALIALTLL